jgi:hypothetical protein
VTTVPNPALRADVENTFERPLTSEELRVVQPWLNQAWTILTLTVPGVDVRMAAASAGTGSLPREAVVQVLVAMVERKLRNPDGLRSWNGDDYTETIDSTLSSGQLYPTPAEIARLSVRIPSSGIYSIPLC